MTGRAGWNSKPWMSNVFEILCVWPDCIIRAQWLLDSELDGRLHDVVFEFSGPVLDLQDWSLRASASDVEFKSVGPAPAMNNLRGQLEAAADGGVFEFTTEDAQFEWSHWFDRTFPIKRANGEFTWRFDADGTAIISLNRGEFEDGTATISQLNATCRVEKTARQVSSLGQLFTVDSVSELTFEDGRVVSPKGSGQRPLSLEASAQFEFNDLSKLVNYLPNDERIDKFRLWSLNAFKSGAVNNGSVSYRGEASRNALRTGKAQLDAQADFLDVRIDYGYQRDWPEVEQGRGSAIIRNELLVITPDEVWLNGDPVTNSQLQIAPLFQRGRVLSVEGKTSTSLVKGMDFLFKGPLIKPENQLQVLPVQAEQGRVDIDVAVKIPLRKVSDAQVTGTAEVRNGSGVLPEGVPISDVNATVEFTERSVTSENIRAKFLGGDTLGTLVTTEEAQPPVMKLSANGVADAAELEPWVGEHLLTWFSGAAPWQGDLLIDGGKVDISGVSNLEGLSISAPAPLAKSASESARMTFAMTVGGNDVQQSLALDYQDTMHLKFQADPLRTGRYKKPSLFDNSVISIGLDNNEELKPGVNFVIKENRINLDEWLDAIIDMASYEPVKPTENTDFLDAMRSVQLEIEDPFFLGREFGSLEASVVSVDGHSWIGTVDGDNIEGTMKLEPRAEVGEYGFRLTRLNMVEEPDSDASPEPIDYSLRPEEYPAISLEVENYHLAGKALGELVFHGRPQQDQWVVDTFTIKHHGISTEARGGWRNTEEQGSISSFDFSTVIDEAEGALTELDFAGIIKKGRGTLNGNINWIGAPHEFDYARLNGEFDLRLRKGELIKVEPGSGKLLGLLNFNAIARRLLLDFSDVFASGLEFDRMQYSGLFSDGEALFRDAYIFTPAVFVRMDGKIDLSKELIDMEVHVSPELGGNLTLLSALANPTAGAVVFLTQRIFKDEMRESSFRSYRAFGTWEDFELVEMDSPDRDRLLASQTSDVESIVTDPESSPPEDSEEPSVEPEEQATPDLQEEDNLQAKER